MSDKSSRRRLSTTVNTSRKPKPKPKPKTSTATISSKHRYSSSPSSKSRNKDLSSRQQSFKHANHPCPILKRSSSEPNLWSDGLFLSEVLSDCDRRFESDFDLFGSQKITISLNSLFSSSSLLSLNPLSFEDYNKDAKVVVNVIVEGSPGPIRTMVRLGSTVDETIRLVVDKYIKEGRTPKLDGSALSSFELHNSYFSMQSLSRTDAMGDVGSRSFYLRKSKSSQSSEDSLGIASSSPLSEIIAVSATSAPNLQHRYIFFPAFFTRKISKIIRRTRTLWKMLGCLQSG